MGARLPGSRHTQGKAHIAGLAWDVKGQQAAYAAGAERVRERK